MAFFYDNHKIYAIISYIYFYTFQENNIIIFFYTNNTFKVTYYSQAMSIKSIKMFLMVYTV